MTWFLVVFLINNPFPLVDLQPNYNYCLAAKKQFIKEHKNNKEIKEVRCLKFKNDGEVYEKYEKH